MASIRAVRKSGESALGEDRELVPGASLAKPCHQVPMGPTGQQDPGMDMSHLPGKGSWMPHARLSGSHHLQEPMG